MHNGTPSRSTGEAIFDDLCLLITEPQEEEEEQPGWHQKYCKEQNKYPNAQ